jgi:pyruvate kinase
VGLVPNETIARRLTIAWGVYPVIAPHFSDFQEMATEACKIMKKMDFASKGDKIVITGSISLGEPGSTNLLSIETIT